MLKTFDQVAAFIRQNEVGRRAAFETPFGRRYVCYADLTATGRYLHFVEQWMNRVRPFYANTHTSVSSMGRIMTELREEARGVIARAVHAGPEDVVLFVGSGTTAAVNKLVGLLGIRIPETLERAYNLSRHIPESEKPVVFVGPYEHHSNLLPWIESIAHVVEAELDEHGQIDLEDLERKLAAWPDRRLKIGSFSAASNVTGLLSDVPGIARVLHRHGAYVFIDYAASAPYEPIDMHPESSDERIDAVFISAHKFMGGPQASGVLVAHRSLFRTTVPERPGGGTVDWVAGCEHSDIDYADRLDEREEGGTPATMGDIRAGVAFLVQKMVDPAQIRQHEISIARQSIERLSAHPRIKILGSLDAPRLAIISLNIDGLHHDFVSVLLDHLFGIQNRSGCSCAGPYGRRLLNISEEARVAYRRLNAAGLRGTKPGWARLSLPYYATQADLDFVCAAVEFVADHGRDFVPAYELCWQTGVWSHIEKPMPDVPPIELSVDALIEAAQSFAAGDHETPLSEAQLTIERARYFKEAHKAVAELRQRAEISPPIWNPSTGRPDIDELMWFTYVKTRGTVG